MSKPLNGLLLVAAAATTLVSGCNSVSGALGMRKVTPDEFRVVTRAPLTVPPDYSLRPPRPGDPRPQELSPDQEARQALFGRDTGQGASSGERTLVDRAGANAVDANVRQQVDFENSSIVHRDGQLADRIIQQGAGADTRTAEQRTADEEAARRATGGGQVVIQRQGGDLKLPGT